MDERKPTKDELIELFKLRIENTLKSKLGTSYRYLIQKEIPFGEFQLYLAQEFIR
jgi:hypothetical protein